MLSRWRKEMREGKIIAKGVDVDKEVGVELKELRRIKKEYERLKIEHDFLKKAIEFTSIRKQMSSASSTTTKKLTRWFGCVNYMGFPPAVTMPGGNDRRVVDQSRTGSCWKNSVGF